MTLTKRLKRVKAWAVYVERTGKFVCAESRLGNASISASTEGRSYVPCVVEYAPRKVRR